MKNMLKAISFMLITLLFVNTTNAQEIGSDGRPVVVKYKYETLKNDPLKTRIYTLENGLKVYLTVYKDEPRIQTYIACKAGAKNDPADATGLAHYFEHLMFKGTSKIGSKDIKMEKMYIAQIEQLFEEYRGITDKKERLAHYRKIDSVSTLAAAYAIPNEYDKLLSLIGAKGTNAGTSLEYTIYINDIPSNQMENWIRIESERFADPVLRLFHTELETVYEEKNMYSSNDRMKANQVMMTEMFKNHNYGDPILGSTFDLKNPSMKRIMEFYNDYYVPNNMAIVLSGDFNPDEAIVAIDKFFGPLKAKPVKEYTFEAEAPIQTPIVKTVLGKEAENLMMGFRLPGFGTAEAEKLTLMDMILSNRQAGLIDLNLNKEQKVLSAGSSPRIMKDYSILNLYGSPKEGQTLEEVKDLLLDQIELIKKGEFPDWLLNAVIKDLRLSEIKELESNSARGMHLAQAFLMDASLEYVNTFNERLKKYTKKDIVQFANEYFSKDNYVLIYKKTGKDKETKKIKKPKITKLKINRDDRSEFFNHVENHVNAVADIEPVFVDYTKDLEIEKVKNVPVLYKENLENETFSLQFVYDIGEKHDKLLPLATSYFEFLGTEKYTPNQIEEQFYKLGITYGIGSSEDEVYVTLRGLNDQMQEALFFLEDLFGQVLPDEDALVNLKKDELKQREDVKLNSQAIVSYMFMHGIYGDDSPAKDILSEDELNAVTSSDLISRIKNLKNYPHKVLYYGPMAKDGLINLIEEYHYIAETFATVPEAKERQRVDISKNKVFIVDYEMKSSTVLMLSNGVEYNKDLAPSSRLYNEYFGGGMNSIVFQELREAKALAYTAFSAYTLMEQEKGKPYTNLSYIITQTDKTPDAINEFKILMNEMPKSESSLSLAKESIITKLQSDRVTKSQILRSYLSAQKMGNDYDVRKDIYEALPNLGIDEVSEFQEKYIKGKPQVILILGNAKELDKKALKKFGKVKTLKLEDIFGY